MIILFCLTERVFNLTYRVVRLKETPRIEQNVRIIRLLRAKQIKYGIAYLKYCFIVIMLIQNYVGL